MGSTGATGPAGATGPTGAAGSFPYPVSADLYSAAEQTLPSTGGYTPVKLQLITPYHVTLEEDGYTITIQQGGLFAVSYSLTVSSGADPTANVALLLPGSGTPAPALALSNKPLLADNTCVTASFVATFTAGEQLILGVYSPSTVVLPATPRRSANALVSIYQIA